LANFVIVVVRDLVKLISWKWY